VVPASFPDCEGTMTKRSTNNEKGETMTTTETNAMSISEILELFFQKLDEREAELEARIAVVRDALNSALAAISGQFALLHRASSPAPSSGKIQKQVTKAAEKPASTKATAGTSSKRTHTNWAQVHQALLAGEDDYVTIIKTSSVDATKSNLLKRFPDLAVTAINKDNGTSMFGVRLRPDAVVAA
jgi:hypothetical protein